jgi:hypothetical protein
MGIAFGIIGWSFIVVGFIGPLFKFLDEHQ